METTTMEIVEFPQRQIVTTKCRLSNTEETKHVTGVFYNVTVATDCRTRVIELWQMVSRIRSAEHLISRERQSYRTTESVRTYAPHDLVEVQYWPRYSGSSNCDTARDNNCKACECISEAQ
jgi:hypothetical protein